MNISKFLLPFLLIITACTAPAPDPGYVPGDVMDIEPLIIGKTIPDISLQNHKSEPVNLLDKSSENTLFVFYLVAGARSVRLNFLNSHPSSNRFTSSGSIL